jgi:hypothetical protein
MLECDGHGPSRAFVCEVALGEWMMGVGLPMTLLPTRFPRNLRGTESRFGTSLLEDRQEGREDRRNGEGEGGKTNVAALRRKLGTGRRDVGGGSGRPGVQAPV